MIENSTSLTAVIEAGSRLVSVDTSGTDVVMFFRSKDDQTEYRVAMFPNLYGVDWTVQEFPVVSNA